jgi:DNA-binding response OmpR family regulator
MHVLREIRDKWPRTRVIIITAHGTVESAVEAMKMGAVDFIQKPFSPKEIRELAVQVLKRENLDENQAADYLSLIELAKRYVSDRNFPEAREITRKAIAMDPAQPVAYNLLGALLEIKGDNHEALKFYRAATDIDPSYKPALANIDRLTSWYKLGGIDFGSDKNQPENPETNSVEKDNSGGPDR